MTNFYNYLMHHNVCLEYREEIKAARAAVKLGRNQLIAIHDLSSLIPGEFNVACSVLLGGSLASSHGISYAAPELEFEIGDAVWDTTHSSLLSAEAARAIIKTACTSFLATEKNEQLFEAVMDA